MGNRGTYELVLLKKNPLKTIRGGGTQASPNYRFFPFSLGFGSRSDLIMMFLKDMTDKKWSRSIIMEQQEEKDDNELPAKKKPEKWHWPIDSVNILDIRQLGDDKEHNRARGYTTDLIDTEAKANRFKKVIYLVLSNFY